MSVPILQNQSAFDAITSHSFQFEFLGDQVFASKLYIYNNDNNSLIYSDKATSFQLKHILPANTLVNGNQYYATLTIFNKDDIESTQSNKILFYCYTQPTFMFTNVVDNQIVQNSSLSPVIVYSQPEEETLNQFQIFLCNASKAQIATSGIKYGIDSLDYTFNGLTDGSSYYVRATGITTHGMQLDTGYIAISINYIQAGQFYKIQLDNNPSDASITISCNVSIITGVSTGNPEFIEDNTMIDLTPKGCTVRFEEGFLIKKDFDMEIIMKPPNLYETVFQAPTKYGTFTIRYQEAIFDDSQIFKPYFSLDVVSSAGLMYKIATSPLSLLPDDLIKLRVKKVNNIYGIHGEVGT